MRLSWAWFELRDAPGRCLTGRYSPLHLSFFSLSLWHVLCVELDLA